MFQAARIKLTAWYLLILMTISISFSLVIYKITAVEVERFARVQQIRIERNLHESRLLPREQTLDTLMPPPKIIDPILIYDIKKRMQLTIFFINLGIFIIAGGLSYILAGKTLRPISEMMEEQNRFISDASHELKTPLTAMKSMLEVHLRDSKLTLLDARKVISENIEEVNKLQTLSETLLELTKHDALSNSNSFLTLSIKPIIDTVIKKMQPMAQQKDIVIESAIEDGTLLGQKEKLTEVFMIILDNAIKYSEEKRQIHIVGKKEGKRFALSFIDRGIGIAKKDLPHIFDRFYRADNARSKIGKGGYGLGLAIAKKITTLHNGEIEIVSKEKKGTTVVITFPLYFSSNSV